MCHEDLRDGGAPGTHSPAGGTPRSRPERSAHPSDLSDAHWELVEPLLAARPHEHHGRALNFGSPPQRYLPHDIPNWNKVEGYFAKWQSDGIFVQLNRLIKGLVRQQEGQNAEPSACVLGRRRLPQATRRACRHPPHRHGNRPTLPRRRWAAERTYSYLMARRLTGEATISWRDPTSPDQLRRPE